MDGWIGYGNLCVGLFYEHRFAMLISGLGLDGLGWISLYAPTVLREDPWNDKCCSNGFLPRGGGG